MRMLDSPRAIMAAMRLRTRATFSCLLRFVAWFCRSGPHRGRTGGYPLAALVLGLSQFVLPGRLPADPVRPPPDHVVRRWIVEDGLPHNTLSRVLQDARGYLWLGTGAGLVRFSGAKFTEYHLPASLRTPSALGENIREVAIEDERTLLAIPTSGGLVRLRDGVFFLHPASAQLAKYSLLDLFVEPDGTLWVGANALGDDGRVLIRWSHGQTRFFGKPEGISRTRIDFPLRGTASAALGSRGSIFWDGMTWRAESWCAGRT